MSKATRRQLAKEDFLGTLEHLEDQIPLTPQEQATMLPPANVIAASLKKLMQTVEQEQARRAQVRLDAGRAGREAAVRKIRASVVHRSRAENLALITAMRSKSPAHARTVAFFRNFETAPDEDLDILVADLQALMDSE